MKVLMLDQFSDTGGAQQVLLELLPAMKRRGWRGVVGLPGEGEVVDRVRDAGYAAERIPCGPYSSGKKRWSDVVQFAADVPRLARRIRELADSVDADVIYVNGPRLLPAAALGRGGRRVVFHAHSFLPPGASRRLAGLSLAQTSARVVGQCEFVTKPWREYVPADRIRVIYNGVAGPGRLPVRRGGGPPRIGCIGRIAPEKGQREFVVAAARIHEYLPECEFVIYGSALFHNPAATEYEAQVRRDAERLPVQFAGWVDDVYQAMSTLDVLLVPSAGNEATTRVIPEAFSAGVPVIAFGSGGIPEVIENGVNGMLACDAAHMAELAVILLTGDPRRLISISHCARESWERRFTLDRHHQELLRAIEARDVAMPVGSGA